VLPTGARLVMMVVAGVNPTAAAPAAAAPAAASPVAALPVQGGRTTTVIASIDVGAPIERAVPSPAYARAAAADAEERWPDAEALYRRALDEWTAIAHTRPSRALDLAIAKAERELRASQTLAAGAPGDRATSSRARPPDDAGRAFERHQALERGRLLAGKLLATRATLGRVSPALYADARDRLEALRDGDPRPAGRNAPVRSADVELLLCATYAAGDVPADARLARARVTQAEREDPGNTVAVAACAAALGDTEAALASLETFVLRPLSVRADGFLRDLYLWNDWDHLRGDPRFESLFP
jgi:hypothetical protein